MNQFEIIAIVVVAILVAVLGVKYLIKHNVKVDEIVSDVEHGIDIVQLVLDAVPIPDGDKIGISTVLTLADRVCDFVNEYWESDLKQDGSKLKVATDAAFEVLNELDVQLTVEERRLVETVVSESLKWLEK